TPLEAGLPGVPGPIAAGDELDQAAIALDEKMSGDPQLGDFAEKGMFADRQPVLEKFLNPARAELPRRQADVVHHQQGHLAKRTRVEIGRRAMANALEPAG